MKDVIYWVLHHSYNLITIPPRINCHSILVVMGPKVNRWNKERKGCTNNFKNMLEAFVCNNGSQELPSRNCIPFSFFFFFFFPHFSLLLFLVFIDAPPRGERSELKWLGVTFTASNEELKSLQLNSTLLGVFCIVQTRHINNHVQTSALHLNILSTAIHIQRTFL